MKPGDSILSDDEVREVKAALWAGDTQERVGMRFRVSQSTVSRISRGALAPHVAWPDGSLGPMPQARRRIIGRKGASAPVSETQQGDVAAHLSRAEREEIAALLQSQEATLESGEDDILEALNPEEDGDE